MLPTASSSADRSPPTWPGRLLFALIALVVLLLFAWGGWLIGLTVVGDRAQAQMNAPTTGVGMAPDLGGFFQGMFTLGAGGFVGAVIGVAVGGVLLWAASRLLRTAR